MAVRVVLPHRTKLTFGSSVGSTANNVVGELVEYTLTIDIPYIDATSNDSSGWREPTSTSGWPSGQYVGAGQDWTLTGTCVFARTKTQNITRLLSNINTGSGNAITPTRVRIQWVDGGSTTTIKSVFGDALLESYEIGASTDEVVLHDFQLRGCSRTSSLT